MIKQIIQIIIKNLTHRKLRTYLTILGIIIGVTALISLMTLGQGLEDGLTKQFDKFGIRRIFIASKTTESFGPPSGIGTITKDDVKTLEKLPFLEFVQPMYRDSAEIDYNHKKEVMRIFGLDTENVRQFLEEVGRELEEGRYLEEGDSHIAIIGYELAKNYFDKEIPLKGSIDIDGQKFRIIGILKEEGSRENDMAIMIPIDDLRLLKNKPEAITAMTAQVVKGYNIDEAATKIERALKRERNDENFIVTNPKQIKEQAGMILGAVRWVVSAIAAISLLVGGFDRVWSNGIYRRNDRNIDRPCNLFCCWRNNKPVWNCKNRPQHKLLAHNIWNYIFILPWSNIRNISGNTRIKIKAS